MRNLVYGIIGIVVGVCWFFGIFAGGGLFDGNGDLAVGHICGGILASAFAVGGAYFVWRSFVERNAHRPTPRPRRDNDPR
jgi:hypothetical protein